ncbi:HAD family hydrolase [Shewanella profunda]|uniref:HAD family hydrolase n=1 Tax=Shewanella profunda TaxID=254793 RepID=UPI00200F8D47|nr:HAD family hydrolase [Shewanella profunda]MCL1091405.1 HAD family hydrolase [Shewanella profunda]
MITRLTDIKLSDIRGVIFDLDGTLAHSNPDFKGLRAELGIDSGTDILGYIHSLDSTQAKMQALEIVHEYERQSSLKASWIEGAEALLSFLKSKPLPLAILTRNMPEAAQITIDKLGIDIALVLTRYDAQPKPHPEGIHLICQQWQLAPADILYVGDYLFDLQTARNAGSRCALYCPEIIPDYAHDADMLITCYHSFIQAWTLGE